MLRKGLCLLLAAVLTVSLAACGANREKTTVQLSGLAATTQATEPTDSRMFVPEDGNPNDITCKGTYTQESPAETAQVAQVADQTLTNQTLWVIYWLEVAAYRQSGAQEAPDYDAPLDSQPCQIDNSVNSWQQYFLRRALNTWHTAQALAIQSTEVGIPTEELYQPNLDNHAKYLVDIPATKYLYGVNNNYRINTLHQQYLDALPETLVTLAQPAGLADGEALAQTLAGVSQKILLDWAELYNTGYAYFTSLSYLANPTEEELEAWMAEGDYGEGGEKYVTVRQILVIPEVPEQKTTQQDETEEPAATETVTVEADGTITCSQAMWALGEQQAQALLEEYETSWRQNQATNCRTTREARFADFAHSNSDDTDSAPDGGLYCNIRQGQLAPELDSWCFDSSRQEGDIGILRSDCGYHIVYFVGATDGAHVQAEADWKESWLADQVNAARETYPMTVTYANIALKEEGSAQVLTHTDLLYSDVAHQRFPEIPLYLQQDYPTARYGNYMLRGHGCGITTMAMVASYLADAELTPPDLANRYGNYCYRSGTDGGLFMVTPSEMGFYVKERTFEPQVAKQALEDGYVVVCVQTKGYWTRGGHYLALEKLVDGLEGETEKRVQVRDSNIFNYGRLKDHKIDAFKWTTIPPNGNTYWIFEYKNVSISTCDRCGNPSNTTKHLLTGGYTCEKCEPALLRRNAYLALCGE